LEPLANSGTILVSDPVHRNVKNKPGIQSTFVNETRLKNVDDGILIYNFEKRYYQSPIPQTEIDKSLGILEQNPDYM
jgi:hypothetical protein